MNWRSSALRGTANSLREGGRLLVSAVAGAASLAAMAALGALTVAHRTFGLAAGALVALAGLVLADPLLIAVAAFPGTLLLQRAGGGAAGSSLSLSDLIVVAASAIAVTKIRFDAAPTLRRSLVPIAAFELLLLLTVLDHPNIHGSLEWAHRIFMVAGSLAVGWAVANSGRARQAAVALLVASMVLALFTLEHAVTLHFKPAQWGLYQKNYLGAMMWMTVVIAHLNPRWLNLPPRLARAGKYLCGLALLASQSKQSIIALMVVLLYTVVRQPSVRRRSKLLLVSLVPLAIVTYLLITTEVANLAVNPQNSIGIRLTEYAADFHVWASSPIFGQGLRWFYLPQFASYIQPPDIFVETLVAGGIVGVIAMIVLLGGYASVFLSLPREIGTIALVLVLGRAVEAVFDIYWVAGAGTLPWLVAGLAIGTWDATLAGHTVMRGTTDGGTTENVPAPVPAPAASQ